MATRIDYAAVLADLEARRDALDTAIKAIKGLPQPDDPAPKPKIGRPPKPASVVPSNPGKHVPQPGDLDYDEPTELELKRGIRSGSSNISGASHGKE